MLKKTIKSFLPHFTFAYQYLGIGLVGLYLLSFLVGTLDAVGISLMIPLLGIIENPNFVPKSKVESILFSSIKFFHIEINLVNILIIIFCIFAIKGLIKYIQSNYKFKLRARLIKKLRLKLIKGFLNLKYSSYLKFNSGKISNTFNSETQQVSSSFNAYNSSVISFFTALSYIVFALTINPFFTICSILSGGLISIFMQKITKKTKAQSIKLSANNGEFSSFLVQFVQNFKYLKSTGSDEHFSKKIQNNIHDLEKSMIRIGTNISLSSSIREPFIILIMLLLIVIQVLYLKNSISSIFVTLFLFYRALNEIVLFQSNWQNFITSFGSFENIKLTLLEFSKNQESIQGLKGVEFKNQISYENIEFKFSEDQNNVLKKVNFQIPHLKTVALVGQSGSGKTTLTDILTALLIPNSGQVKVDGYNLSELDLVEWRKKFGYISQEQTLFNDSILNNVSMWDDSLSEHERIEKVNNALVKANCTFVNGKDVTIDTQIGERGVNLSGGQRQRIAIAREFYKDVEIFIFDEATSALDSESENFIKSSIDQLKGKVTIIIIAHRLSTIKDADLVCVMNLGEVLEFDSYKNLSEKSDGVFQNMLKLQKL